MKARMSQSGAPALARPTEISKSFNSSTGVTPEWMDRKLQNLDDTLRTWVRSLFALFQKFAEEHFYDQMVLVENRQASLTHKLDGLEVLTRYGIFFSTDQLGHIYLLYKKLYKNASNQNSSFATGKHQSMAPIRILQSIRAEMQSPPQDRTLLVLSGNDGVFGPKNSYDKYYATSQQKITYFVSLLEIAMINDQCNEQIVLNNVVDTLCQLVNRE